MCGIFFYCGTLYKISDLVNTFMNSSQRGPDSSSLKKIDNGIIGFHRLAIMDLSNHGDQPFYDKGNVLVCNGEIYNYKNLLSYYDITTDSSSDCSVLLPLYEKLGVNEMVNHLDGDFAIVIVDNNRKVVHMVRDPVGVKPLFYGFSRDGELFIASEIKSIKSFVNKCNIVHSGTIISYNMDNKSIHTRYWWDIKSGRYIPRSLMHNIVREKLSLAVKKRLMSNRPVGLFISGGLDSSLVASIACNYIGSNVHTFSIGMEGSPDLEAARKVVKFLGIRNHHEVNFTVEEGVAAIPEVIKALETFDITTIRASVPQYLLSKYIAKNTDIKVLLSGEGSDELFGGYLYFHKAPSNELFNAESKKLIKELEYFDVLRADRTTAAWGLEVRVPFLDRGFINCVMSLSPECKNPKYTERHIEKEILRDSFIGYLPEDILYRTKDAFSDACGRQWIPSVQDICEKLITDDEFTRAAELYPHLTPKSKEAFCYRKIFEELYPGQSHLVPHYWLPNWCNSGDEPSAKLLNLL
jgi:asparagine synthase (glutamine-hydrolysing)